VETGTHRYRFDQRARGLYADHASRPRRLESANRHRAKRLRRRFRL
jgi:hypothetical protein